MFRTAGMVGALAVAGTVGLLAAGTASAAPGGLNLNGEVHTDPVGCYNTGDHFFNTLQTTVTNGTDRDITLYAGPDCAGQVLGVLPPNKIGYVPKGGSVSVP
ncbi:hypothetical protein [Nocardia donostiensis]|uniref:Secreted protein n=1 Tax=Nocardia donostiensis TaxID=1538463 RepID=A0A1W0BM71_9NOCA|nr:hypothetical protein [Nocardia donostiensis]ONM50121.1 hypothetical protein B0T46_03260 [Nocardia donostiensis]OQS15783.1 hypothetical protein B0T36_07355 [Nocardia donostiensis]OQS23588.1 hypothetical protein B0T44_01795 [Nocardia donostiensis]